MANRRKTGGERERKKEGDFYPDRLRKRAATF